MRLTLAPTVLKVSGTVGACTFGSAFGRPYLRTRPRHTPSNTAAQIAQRAHTKALRVLRESLDPRVRVAQQNNARHGPYSWWSWFVWKNYALELDHLARFLIPSHPNIPTPQAFQVVRHDNTWIKATWTPVALGAYKYPWWFQRYGEPGGSQATFTFDRGNTPTSDAGTRWLVRPYPSRSYTFCMSFRHITYWVSGGTAEFFFESEI